jgi:3-oxoadipate enol-lactonase
LHAAIPGSWPVWCRRPRRWSGANPSLTGGNGESPEIEPLRAWLEAEIQRGLGRTLVDAGRALSKFDSRPWAHELKLPAVVCVTLRDRLVPPRKQRVLAKKLRAEIIEIDGDHDVTLVDGPGYAAATLAAVNLVAAQLAKP